MAALRSGNFFMTGINLIGTQFLDDILSIPLSLNSYNWRVRYKLSSFFPFGPRVQLLGHILFYRLQNLLETISKAVVLF